MGYKCTFMDNDVYYANDVNAMFANITSSGVVLRNSGNILSDLNAATQEMVTEGVTSFANSCKLIISDGIYKICEGVCFMHDGSAITFDTNGYEILPLPDVTTYVYIKRNDAMNTIDVLVSAEAGGEEAVPIAEIDASGNIYDRRKYAQAKVKLNCKAEVRAFECVLVAGESPVTLDLERGDFSRIILNTVTCPSGNTTATNYPCYHNLLEIQDGVEIACAVSRSENYSLEHIVYFTKNGSQLTLRIERGTYRYPYTVNFEVL